MESPILITGVAKRIGFELASHFLHLSIPILGTYRSEHQQLELLIEQGAVLYRCDFYDDASFQRFLQSITNNASKLRAIIHNASDWTPDSNEQSAATTIDRMMKIHVSIPYQINLALQSLLLADATKTKDIIHLTDYVAGKGSKKHIAYAASKAALENLTLSFAAKFAPTIKVNAIAPALIKFNPDDDDDYKRNALDKSLLPWEGGVDEVINTVEYLLNSNYVTGRTMHLDGGRHIK